MAKSKVIDPIGQILTLAARRHRVRTAAMLSDIGLFPGQDKVLESLQGVEGLTMSEIAATLDVRPPTASKMVARMAAQGLLGRKGREGDARMVMVSITDEGRGRLDDLRRIAKRVEREALVGLDDKDIRRLRRLLKKVSRNLAGKGARHEAGLPDGEAADAGDMPELADATVEQSANLAG
jgi:DNA-binding MarR family transcriptional regulator